ARAELRASHEDRDIIVDQLRVAAGDGRIDAEELDQRIEAALNARTYGELDVLTKDLPPSTRAAGVARRSDVEESQSINVAHANIAQRDLGSAGPEAVRLLLTGQVQHANVRVRRLSGFLRRRRTKAVEAGTPRGLL